MLSATDGEDTPSLAEKALPKMPAPDSDAAAPEALPPEWRSERAILCVAGHGPLDEAASAMLAQLLGKHGLGAQPVPHAAVARGRVSSLDVSGVAMVCISYLEISGSPAHLRYLLRRLRQRLPPGAPILVGLWPAEEAVLKDPQIQKQVGADHYTSSLREAVAACLNVACEKSAAGPLPAPARRPDGEPAPGGRAAAALAAMEERALDKSPS